MTNDAKPQRPSGLSGQEEEELRTLEKGYDPQAGALPDPELPVHDDRDHKPGDGPVTRHEGESGSSPGAANSTRERAPKLNPDATDPRYEGPASVSPGSRNPSA